MEEHRVRFFICYIISMDLNTLLKHTSRSLYLSAKILPPSIRPAFGIAYLLCRYADTIADTALLPAPRRLYWIEKFPQLVRKPNTTEQEMLTRELSGTSDNPYEAALITHLTDCINALEKTDPALKPYIYDVVSAVCEGMKIDLTTFPNEPTQMPGAFNTSAELALYCRLMGGKPGLFWSQLICYSAPVKRTEETFWEYGEKIGDALQIVNILRDLPKDLQQGRCYFPRTELHDYNLTSADLKLKKSNKKFIPIKQKWIRWGKENLGPCCTYYNAIPKQAWQIRAAVAWPLLWTADTFAKLNKEPDLLNPKKRVKISRARIYATLLVTPALLLSNRLFNTWMQHKLKKLP